jgi:hypothetical protein
MRNLALSLLAPLLGACASWTPVERRDTWTLYVKNGESVDIDRFGKALDPAFAAVEERMGAFEQRVRVHAWEEDDAPATGTSNASDSATSELHVVPGIGPARVRAYHVKGGPLFFRSSGVFLGTSDVGTVVHELVHARIAELDRRLPLWFEEGLASLYGDGAVHGGRWVNDGLACWPLRELRELTLSDAELEKLLRLAASDEYDARENLLVHFVGWAILFDVARSSPEVEWTAWLAIVEREAREHGLLAAARRHIQATLGADTESQWLERLRSEDPGVRFAAAKGTWKLRSPRVVDLLLDALDRENDIEVRAVIALNVLLATGETRMGRTRWNRVSASVFPVLRDPKLADGREVESFKALYQAMRRWDSRGSRSRQSVLADLARFWEE